MIRAALVVIALTGSAAASPLGVVWRHKTACPAPFSPAMISTPTELVWVEGGKLQRRTLATGAALPSWKLAAARPTLKSIADGLALLDETHGIAVIDVATGKRKWHRALADVRAAMAQGAVAFWQAPKKPTLASSIELADAATGKTRWTVPVPADTRVSFIGIGQTRAFVAVEPASTSGDRTVTAYNLADGAVVWTAQVPSELVPGQPTPLGDELTIGTKNALRWFDAKGAATSVALDEPDVMLVKHDRIYVLTGVFDHVVAIDRASRHVAWTAPRTDGIDATRVVAATATSVYISDADQVVELDARTGARVASFGVAHMALYQTLGTPIIIACEGHELVALDPSAADVPLETASVTGVVHCTNCEPGPIWVKIGGQQVSVDKRGRFTLTVTGRGTFAVDVVFFDHPVNSVMYSTPGPPLVLTGANHYDLKKISVEQMQEGE